MATGDTNAPEDHEAGTVGGSSGRGAGFDNDRSDRNKQPRPKGPAKLPSEYAGFKLADGRTLRDVMGDKFFGAKPAKKSGGGKWLSKGVRKLLQKGGSSAAGGFLGQAIRSSKFNQLDGVRGMAGPRADARQRANLQARIDERRKLFMARKAALPGANPGAGGEL